MWIKITENISLEIVRNVIIIERLNLSGKSLLTRKNCIKYKEYETHVNNGSTFVRKYNDVLLFLIYIFDSWNNKVPCHVFGFVLY